jgi:arylsulfatase B/arylsulfatase I/J
MVLIHITSHAAGMFKPQYLPQHRGFNFSTGMLSGASDHYTHVVDGAYDWHAMDQPDYEADGRYAGNLVRDDALAFLQRVSGAQPQPFFLYLPFQECHAPFQVDTNYSALYPQLPKGPRRTLPGMVTHTDEMIGDVVRALKQHGRWEETVVIFSADNGGPGNEGWVSPSRWDPHVIERNWPYVGQKHEVWEGGVHVAGWINGGLLPPPVRGTTHSALLHVSDYAPTLMHLLAGVDDMGTVAAQGGMPLAGALDGHNMWACLTALPGESKQTACAAAGREDILYNVNLICDPVDPEGPNDFYSEVPAPKAGLRKGDMVVLAECYDWESEALRGRTALYNVTADKSQRHDLAASLPAVVAELGVRLAQYGQQAVRAALSDHHPPQVTAKPWAALWDPGKDPAGGGNSSYFCAGCPAGVAPSFPASGGGSRKVWSPWCHTAPGDACPPSPPGPPVRRANCSASDFCANHPTCDCHCYCTVCHGLCGNGCYDKCHGGGGCTAECSV